SLEELTNSVDTLNNTNFNTFISNLEKIGSSLTSLKDTALSFINSFDTSSNDLKTNLINYNKKRAKFEDYFNSDGSLKDDADLDSVKSLYGEISSIAKNIASTDDTLKSSLIDRFEKDITQFDLAQDVIKVSIVDGLGNLVNLSALQLAQLQLAFKDGTITNDELENIANLSKEQMDKILDFISNSSYFNLDKNYNQNSSSQNLERLSKQTLTYNDYVGVSEQLDIVKLLGVSYNTAKPLIESLQNLGQLDSSKLFSYVSDLVGFKSGAENYDLTAFSQIQSLNPYLSIDVSTILETIKKQALENKVKNDKLKTTLNSYDVGSTNIEYDQIAKIHKNEMIVPKNFSDGIREGNLMLGDNNSIVKEIKNLIEISIQGFEQVRKMRKEVEFKGVM
ncbi:MAG: hypothetical protein DI602_11445, partial [Aliarcobacter butzleri]